MEPLSYYHRTGPIGELLTRFAVGRPNGRVGVIGLGIGSLVTYASVDQRWTFYEIDPAIVRIASDPQYFTFLTNAAIRPTIVLGDARLSLRNAVARGYDLVIVDAFSSDAIPVHLMTREAVAIYMGVLAEHGVLAFHISNRHLNLEPCSAALLKREHMTAILRVDAGPDESCGQAEFVHMADDGASLKIPDAQRRQGLGKARTGAKDSVWTGDFQHLDGIQEVLT